MFSKILNNLVFIGVLIGSSVRGAKSHVLTSQPLHLCVCAGVCVFACVHVCERAIVRVCVPAYMRASYLVQYVASELLPFISKIFPLSSRRVCSIDCSPIMGELVDRTYTFRRAAQNKSTILLSVIRTISLRHYIQVM